jgi:hypothetical protein
MPEPILLLLDLTALRRNSLNAHPNTPANAKASTPSETDNGYVELSKKKQEDMTEKDPKEPPTHQQAAERYKGVTEAREEWPFLPWI